MSASKASIERLRDLAARPGHRLTARDAAGLRLAVEVMEAQEEMLSKQFDIYREQSLRIIDLEAMVAAARVSLALEDWP
ncbi:hypothetical protein [Azohydromonas aeria]|uniref:hypothetical protein n=1 Tax=Azohydromonas aeria TaxID=2590212 RepID=UPI0012FA4BEE|nr:hypothetical protein [Azohydromonas aeria]